MPRPKKTILKDRWLSLRLTAADARKLNARAKARRTTLTGYAREALLTATPSARFEAKNDPELQAAIRAHTRALNRIGVNLNQIAHALNAMGRLVPQDLYAVLGDIEVLIKRDLMHDHTDQQG